MDKGFRYSQITEQSQPVKLGLFCDLAVAVYHRLAVLPVRLSNSVSSRS